MRHFSGASADPPRPQKPSACAEFSGFIWGENAGWLNFPSACPLHHLLLEDAPLCCHVDDDGLVDGQDIAVFVPRLIGAAAPPNEVRPADLEKPTEGAIDLDGVRPRVTCPLSVCY